MDQQETTTCPLCQSGSRKAFVRASKGYRLYDCPDCGAGFCLPFKSPGPEYYAHFEDVYPHQAQETTDPMSEEYGECLRFLRSRGPRGRRLLDVGCGGGGFLNRARKEGFQVSGVDFNKVRADVVRSRLGISAIHVGSLESFSRANPAERFDALTMFQVLEHLDDPGKWLDAAHSLLKPDGYFFIGVPNRDRTFDPFQGPGLEEIDNPPHHLTRWSARALQNILERHSFQIVELKRLGVPLPLLALLLRNRLRFGLAAKALNTDQTQHAKSGGAGGDAGVIRRLVAFKEKLLNALAWLLYPGFRLAFSLLGWQGVALYCVVRRKENAAA